MQKARARHDCRRCEEAVHGAGYGEKDVQIDGAAEIASDHFAPTVARPSAAQFLIEVARRGSSNVLQKKLDPRPGLERSASCSATFT
jgi:hypothetical protein